MKISLIIPVYRGKEILIELYRRIREALFIHHEYEVLFICDNCDPISTNVVYELNAQYPECVKVFSLAQNYGQHRAIQFGFSKASGDYIVTMDEDLQHNPADILKMIDKCRESGFDIVYGRFANPQHSRLRNISSLLLREILKFHNPELFEEYSPFRLIKRDIANQTTSMVSPYIFIDEFLGRVTNNIGFIDVVHSKRFAGKSSYTPGDLFKNCFLVLLAYSRIITLMLTFAALLIVLGITLTVLDFSPKHIMPIIFGIGGLSLVTGFTGILINHWRIIINSSPVRLKL